MARHGNDIFHWLWKLNYIFRRWLVYSLLDFRWNGNGKPMDLINQLSNNQRRGHGSQVIEADGSPTVSGRGPGSQMGAGPGRGDGIGLVWAATAGGFR